MMLLNKKWLLIAILALSMVVLAACGGGDAPAEEETPAEGEAQYIVLEEDFGAEEFGIGFRNEDIALGMEVQNTIDAMIADGTAAEISQKWFGEDIVVNTDVYLEDNTIPEGDQSLQKVLDSGKLIMGLDDSFPPMGFRDDANEIVGFDIDLAKEVATRLGVELVLTPISWDAKELELSTGKIDLIWNGMTVLPERLEAMFIPKAYVNNRQVIIVAADSGIATKADLADKIVGLQKGSSALSAVQKDETTTASLKEIVEYEDNVSAYLDLQAGRIDAFVVDVIVGNYFLANESATAPAPEADPAE